jgi:hypothetical protein
MGIQVNKSAAGLLCHLGFLLAALSFLVLAYLLYYRIAGQLPGPWGDGFIWLGAMYIGVIYPIRRKQSASSSNEA